MSDQTISASVPFVVAKVAAAEGLPAAGLLHGTGVSADEPPRADDHIPIERYYDVWRRVLDKLDAAFPLRVARAFQLEDHEVFGFLAISCQTLGEAYARTAQYRSLYSAGMRWELQMEPAAARLILYPWTGDRNDPGYRGAIEFAVADMADAIQRLGKTSPRPTAVAIAHAAPDARAAYAAFYGVEPHYGALLDELHYPPDLLALPIHTANSRLRDYFDEQCKDLVTKLGAVATTTAQVRKQMIAAMDGGDTSVETIAKQLGTSSRSLQRKLADEGTKYADILTDVRTEFAKRYLARQSISASEVAYLLGFTEPPAFFKAFKRWTGMTPREFQVGAAA